MMRETPLGHDRTTAADDPSHALRSQRNVTQAHARVDREVVHALLGLLDERVAEDLPAGLVIVDEGRGALVVATPDASASKRVIGPAPDWPSSRRSQVASTPLAKGVTSPSPVTTTLRIVILPLPVRESFHSLYRLIP